MNTSINTSNIRQASTAIAQHCSSKSKGKAKQSAIAESISHFLGFKNADQALANGKKSSHDDAHNVAYILTWKGEPTIYLSEGEVIDDILTELTEGEVRLGDLTFSIEEGNENDEFPVITIDNGMAYPAGFREASYITIQPVELRSRDAEALTNEERDIIKLAGSANDFMAIIKKRIKSDESE